MDTGYLIVNVYNGTVADPIKNATVEILDKNYVTETDVDGQTEKISLDAPSVEYSNTPQSEIRPYSTYDIRVTKEGMVPVLINDVEIFPGEVGRQDVFMQSVDDSNQNEVEETIDDNTLWKDYGPKVLSEEPVVSKRPKVLPVVVIPEYITVHDGIPSNTSAANYYVSFPDYVKNVASSEIYSTWPKETIKANIAAIVSFTLNRIYTEWYRSKGYDFTITSSPLYDHKYTHGRTIYDSISTAVDEYFRDYIKFPNRNEPFLAQYRSETTDSGVLSQWGSKALGDQGYSSTDILKYYYGSNLTMKEAPLIGDYPTSFPGYNLEQGMCSEGIQKLQNELNIIRGNYPGIPMISPADGRYNTSTKNAVSTFQSVFGLPVSGIVDYATWYKISYIYTAVAKLNQSLTS